MYNAKYLVPVVVFLTLATSAFALDPSSSPMPKRSEMRQELRQEIKTERQEFVNNVAALHARRIERRFGFYYTRLSSISTRLQARISALKGEGKDITSAQAKLDTAIKTLESAKTKGSEAIAAFRAIDPAKFSEQKDKAFAARDLATEARKLFKTATDQLKLATKEARALSK